MAEIFEEAGLTLVLAGAVHSSAQVAILVEDIQALISSAVWATLTNVDEYDDSTRAARGILLQALEANIAGARFYPGFHQALRTPGALPFEAAGPAERGRRDRLRDVSPLAGPSDPMSPFDVATFIGVNSWMQREILRANPELHRQLFDFAVIRRAEHNSPLLLELGIVVGAVVAVPVVLTYGLMSAVARAKRLNVEAEIREVELQQKKVALKQRELQLVIQKELADALRAERKRNRDFHVPDAVLASVVQFAEPAVAELGSSPLIEKISFSASIGGKS